MDIVLSHLPSESVVAFTLTCRAFYSKYYLDQSTKLDGESRQTLLLWLEKDEPRLYYCHICNLLHRWGPRHRILSALNNRLIRKCRIQSGYELYYSWSVYDFRPRVHFAHVRLVMNRHLFGEGHGPAVQTLNSHGMSWSYITLDGIAEENSARFRIIDSELYAEVANTFFNVGGHGVNFREGFNVRRSKTFCTHLETPTYGTILDGNSHFQSATIGENWPSDSPMAAFKSVLSCPICFVDYKVEISHRHPLFGVRDKVWSIKVTKWHRLGDGRHPSDPKWYNRGGAHLSKDIVPRSRMCPAGSIYQTWKADEEGVMTPVVSGFLQVEPWLKSSGAALDLPTLLNLSRANIATGY